ncbi:LA2681 family HEPN domain-containing protein [Thermoanaerobacterium thermosaccharolyticum]|uniref:LA2681 family HEPN domain-containing protein n=1 Tax=Thermoanaerobacterium thermosaccharolyticum TaxID=1517 RepID=UPI001781C2E5|nr:LA2681 family HEPN domain-containing protein [Thermoanaerobacterium thermosaccharolyticum]MBE0069278.1 tetratricopeptide repeat protein [Thermoanaerobacterium thermosaccharolyticum]MBE0229064.1 tetratricopeptide repeat protein [Thermoanaerobacterium thermosaccharolyticum]
MELYELHKEICNHIDNGEFDKAMEKIALIEVAEVDPKYKSYILSGIYIDIGSIKHDEDLVNKGIGLILENLNEYEQQESILQSVYYNLANGYSALFNLKRINNFTYGFMKTDTEAHKAIKYYKKSLECREKLTDITVQTYVNLGNTFDSIGRNLEALYYYDKALAINPYFGMALANKGLALKYYAEITGEHWRMYYMEAYNFINLGLKYGVHSEAKKEFLRNLHEIKKYVNNVELSDLEKPKMDTQSDFEKFLVEFCIKHKLYLNLCNFCQKCQLSLGDDIVIKNMIVDIAKSSEDDTYLKLSSFLNEIKENYVAARFLLVQSVYRDNDLSFADKNVAIIDTLDYVEHNIFIQLLKFAFRNMYDILDKVSIFLNEYLELGKKVENIDFNNIWYEKKEQNKFNINNKIIKTKNYALNALFNIHLEFKNGEYKDLREIRNALTHRFLNVYWMGKYSFENMNEEYLVDKTIQITQIIRNVIIYLISFVYMEEAKKGKKLKGKLVTLNAYTIPDHLKNL